MNLLDKMEKAMEGKQATISENVPPVQIKDKRPYTRRLPKPDKIVVPEHIKVLFDNLDKSISSVWGIQSNGKIKWDAKYSMWTVFKEYFKELL